MPDLPDDITAILEQIGEDGRDDALDRLLPLVYGELHRISEGYLARERPDHTLQATALVHEAYLRLSDGPAVGWRDRSHFYRVAAKVMRRILVNHALARKAQKRGGGARRISLTEADAAEAGGVDVLDLEAALGRLAAIDERKCRVVELRFFGGCTTGEIADALGISTATAEREWRFARAWLRTELDAP